MRTFLALAPPLREITPAVPSGTGPLYPERAHSGRSKTGTDLSRSQTPASLRTKLVEVIEFQFALWDSQVKLSGRFFSCAFPLPSQPNALQHLCGQKHGLADLLGNQTSSCVAAAESASLCGSRTPDRKSVV